MIGVCHCGHALETHFEKKATCLSAKCSCKMFRDSEKADRYDPPRRIPNHALTCECYDCTHGGRVIDDDTDVETSCSD